MRVRTSVALLVALCSAALASPGCGSDDNNDLGGPTCIIGDTRPCLGSGQCAGAQQCLPDQSGFGPCDCGAGSGGGAGDASHDGSAGSDASHGGGGSGGGGGASGGTAGVSGTAGVAGSPGTGGGAGAGGSAGAAGTGGVSGGPGDAGTDAPVVKPPGPLDDPCPTGDIYLNCSESCGTGRDEANCAKAECDPNFEQFVITDPTVFPITVRTPANPGAISKCDCPTYATGKAIYGIQIRFNYPPYPPPPYNYKYYKVSVAPPWRVQRAEGDLSFPHTDEPCQYGAESCGSVSASGQSSDYLKAVHITTADPNAPARNVVIEGHYSSPSCVQ